MSDSEDSALSELNERMTIEELSSWLQRKGIPDQFCQILAGKPSIKLYFVLLVLHLYSHAAA